MRELTLSEVSRVSGAGDDCGNELLGISDSEGVGKDIINIYEGLIEAVSYMIERVADAL